MGRGGRESVEENGLAATQWRRCEGGMVTILMMMQQQVCLSFIHRAPLIHTGGRRVRQPGEGRGIIKSLNDKRIVLKVGGCMMSGGRRRGGRASSSASQR